MKQLSAAFVTLTLIGCAASSTSTSSLLPTQAGADYGRTAARNHASAANTTAFTTSGKTIYLSINNGAKKPFYIKGVDYSPTQVCSTYIEPLDDGNEAIWKQDLPQMRALGVNAVRVYDTGMKKVNGTWTPTSIEKWLTAAYNDGKKPVYTVLEINFPAGAVAPSGPTATPNPGAVTSLSHQYYELAKTLGGNPDLMGVSISGEVNGQPFVTYKNYWTLGMNKIIAAANQGYIDGGGYQKLLMTSMENDTNQGSNSAMAEGNKYGFPTGNFAWGYDIYGGLNGTLSYVTAQQTQYPHPFLLGEWGEPVGYHPHPNTDPSLVQEWAWPSASPSPAPTPSNAITAYLDEHAQAIYSNSTAVHPNSGVDSGGFYFEWSDEWWAADQTTGCHHRAGPPSGSPPVANSFPSGFWDNAWFGLNSVAAPGSGSGPDPMTQRPTFLHLQADFAAEK